VLGGGDVAIDVACTALRLGADEVNIACLESRDKMPAHRREIEAAEAEGITIYPEHAFKAVLHQDERIVGVECLDVAFMEFDEEGHLTLETHGDSEQIIPCDMVIFAVGQVPDIDFLSTSGEVAVTARGFISVDPVTLATGRPGVLAGGDVIPGCGMAAEALGLGKRGALSIDAYLNGESFAPQEEPQVVTHQELNINYYYPSERHELPHLSAAERSRDFREINYSGYEGPTAQSEASRCFSCGDCFKCDNCWVFCPDMAVIRLNGGQGYRFEYPYCKGCGICAQECPCNSIDMIPDENAEVGT